MYLANHNHILPNTLQSQIHTALLQESNNHTFTTMLPLHTQIHIVRSRHHHLSSRRRRQHLRTNTAPPYPSPQQSSPSSNSPSQSPSTITKNFRTRTWFLIPFCLDSLRELPGYTARALSRIGILRNLDFRTDLLLLVPIT